jgi:cysteine desulfurase
VDGLEATDVTPIYLDYNATTPIDPAVVEAMLPYLQRDFGNPSSTHAFGQAARAAIEQARARVASLIGAQPDEIIFTGSGTEASNLAIQGTVFQKLGGFWGRWGRGSLVVTSSIEHPATAEPCAFLRRLGTKISTVPVDRTGLVDPAAVRRALGRSATIVSIMHANNEVGTLQPIGEIAALARECGARVHADAAQSLGKIAVRVDELGVDLLTIAGHKLYAPKGVGALYVRRGTRLEPVIHGASQENGLRAGTENVACIVALGKACELAQAGLPAATEKLTKLRDRLWQLLAGALGERVVLNGHPQRRLPNTLNVSFAGQVGAEMLQRLPRIAASTGSACHEGRVSQSPVLCAMGVPTEIGKGAVRLSVGRFTTEAEIDEAAEVLIRAV